jgi:hypothetical protein
MPETLSSKEFDVVTKLERAGLSRAEALALVTLTTRSYSRPHNDLVATLQHYAGLEDSKGTSIAVDSLLNRQLLQRDESYGVKIIGPAPDARDRIAQLCNDTSLAQTLTELRRINDEYVTVIGPLRDADSYRSYLDVLRRAHSSISFSMIATSSDGLTEVVDILKERALSGVKVRILGASAKLAAKIRGGNMEGETKKRIKKWKEIAGSNKNIHFRITDTKEDLIYASSVCVDQSTFRLVVYDFDNERSKEGVVVQFSAKNDMRLNSVQAFCHHFDQAFRRGYWPMTFGKILNLALSFWHFPVGILILAGLLLALEFIGKNKPYALQDDQLNILISSVCSIAASFIFVDFVAILNKWRSFRKQRSGTE